MVSLGGGGVADSNHKKLGRQEGGLGLEGIGTHSRHTHKPLAVTRASAPDRPRSVSDGRKWAVESTYGIGTVGKLLAKSPNFFEKLRMESPSYPPPTTLPSN